jgi:HJR/Mrr/RecB family endonuclease
MRPKTTALRKQLYERAKGHCEICGRKSSYLDIEHLHVRAATETATLENLLLVCASCNQRLRDPGQESIRSIKAGAMQAYEFERAVVAALGRRGFALLTEVTGSDAGVDIVARRQDPETGERFSVVVQCKSTQRPIAAADLVTLAEKRSAYRGDVALLVVNQAPSARALALAKRLGIRLTTLAEVDALASSLTGETHG